MREFYSFSTPCGFLTRLFLQDNADILDDTLTRENIDINMKPLWAPWRMEYILGEDKPPGCIFCPWENEDLRSRLILFSGRLTRIMMNKFPYINGHLLVSPLRHVPDLNHLNHEELLDLLLKVRESLEILKKVMHPDGFNVGLNLGAVAGAGVESHVHFHIVPRWLGDTNFVPVFADVRVIPEHFQATYLKLLPHFEELGDGE